MLSRMLQFLRTKGQTPFSVSKIRGLLLVESSSEYFQPKQHARKPVKAVKRYEPHFIAVFSSESTLMYSQWSPRVENISMLQKLLVVASMHNIKQYPHIVTAVKSG